MKKVIAAAAGLLVAGSLVATSASAVENQFGGYWRTRFTANIDWDGTDSGTQSWVDTRTRLYYTAVFNENFKFVNKFEMDAIWGGPSDGYGDVGSDGVAVEVKNSYADFNLANMNFKVGVQGFALARGLLMDDDASGIQATINAGAVEVPIMWIKTGEEEAWGSGTESDVFGIAPVFSAGEGLTIQPYVIYATESDTDTDMFWAGADIDGQLSVTSYWGTAIYNFGETEDDDVSAFLVAAGASVGPVHGQVFYATGDDNDADDDIEEFQNPGLRSYYWSEILGYGTFDYTDPAYGPADGIANVYAANVGFSAAPSEKLSVGVDLWYASLAEDDENGESELGTEIDLSATYMVYENLKLDLVAAYLFAGEAYGGGDEDPIELGAMLSLSF